MVKGIRIGASLADFMGGTNFIQSHGDHDAADQLACLECNELTAEQQATLRSSMHRPTPGPGR